MSRGSYRDSFNSRWSSGTLSRTTAPAVAAPPSINRTTAPSSSMKARILSNSRSPNRSLSGNRSRSGSRMRIIHPPPSSSMSRPFSYPKQQQKAISNRRSLSREEISRQRETSTDRLIKEVKEFENVLNEVLVNDSKETAPKNSTP